MSQHAQSTIQAAYIDLLEAEAALQQALRHLREPDDSAPILFIESAARSAESAAAKCRRIMACPRPGMAGSQDGRPRPAATHMPEIAPSPVSGEI